MFNKILIANRGEIAVRVMATCREMGIRTVAVYSEADRNARHVQAADEAYYIGPAPAPQSYLRIDIIIDAARKSGVEAIHPGYGFLSENDAFVEACDAAEIIFIGPPAAAMRQMGSKITARQIAQSAGVPIVPGYNGAQQDDETLLAEARRAGFPLLIKASAGGGGKGMREVYEESEFLDQLAGARREALSAFGDATVFLERLIRQPRHIEIQVLGDAHGSMVYLGERECSIQRRHQKIVEESPSVALKPALRAEMGEAAVRIAQAAGYVNAGTLEFMLDADQRYYFLEMNTRLQVEHPVTELVTGLDLVRHQVCIAAGEPLGMTQKQVQQRGHAIEVRLYAEDPQQNFLPSTGTLAAFLSPAGPGVRVDSGVASGDEITQFYDPMIAKLIIYGEDRPAAIARLEAALEQTVTLGVKTNAELLLAIARHPAFQEGLTHTHFLDEYGLIEAEQQRLAQPPDPFALYAAACSDILRTIDSLISHNGAQDRQLVNPWLALGSWRMTGEARGITYHYSGQAYHVSLTASPGESGIWTIQAGNWPAVKLGCIFGDGGLVLLREDSQQVLAHVLQIDRQTQVAINGLTYRFARQQPPDVDTTARGGSAAHTQKALAAPMAGTIVKVQVRDGESVRQRQVLAILSAMKMEHTIIAPYEGKVRHVFYREGDVVKGGAIIVEME